MMKAPYVSDSRKHRHAILATVLVSALAAFGSGCSSSDPEDGKLACGNGAQQCPTGYYCASDLKCWTNGHGPDSGVTTPLRDGSQADTTSTVQQDSRTDTQAEAGGRDGDVQKPSDGPEAMDGKGTDAISDAAFDQATDGTSGDVSPDEGPEQRPDVPSVDQAPAPAEVGRDTPPDVPTFPEVGPEVAGCPSDKVTCNGKCIDKTACCTAADCNGSCMTCNASNTCVAVTNQADPTGRCTGTCDSTGACKSKQGTGCQTVGGGCAAGLFCSPEGVCCDKACTGTCEACDVHGSEGTCKAVAAHEAPHGSRTACSGSGDCAGYCDGTNTACTYPTAACGAAACTTAGYQAVGACKSGTCSIPAVAPCTYTCDVAAGGCTGVCTPNQVQCSPTGNVPQKCSASGGWVNQTACTNGYTCSQGACACQSPRKECGGSCIDVSSDSNNCGDCGHPCLGGTCSGGMCQPVAIATSLGNTFNDIFGIDASNLYYAASESGSVMISAYRIGKAVGSTATAVVTDSPYSSFRGVIGSMLGVYSQKTGSNYIYDPATDTNNMLGSYGTGRIVAWGSTAPAYAAVATAYSSPMNITWYTTAAEVKASFDDTLDDYTNLSYDDFYQYQNKVFFLRTYQSTTRLFSISYTDSWPTEMLSSDLSSTMTIVDVNAPSTLLWAPAATGGILYRVPNKTSSSLQLISAISSASAMATEDSTYVYWFDGNGKLSRCTTSSSGCTGTTTMATGQSPSARLYQDDKALYWGDQTKHTIIKLAK
jgi:hypothetical protein